MKNDSKAILDDILSRCCRGKIGKPVKQWNAIQALTNQPVREVLMAKSNFIAIHPCVKRGGKTFYLYTHARPCGTIFYVGKGVGDRAKDFFNRNEWHQRICAKVGIENIQIGVYPTLDERHALAVEVQMIAALKKAGFILCNATNGGESGSGRVFSDEHRRRLSEAGKGFKKSAETLAKMSAASKGRVKSDATRAKLASKTLSDHHKAALLAAITGRSCSDETKRKIGAANAGRPKSPETLQKMSAARKGVKSTPEAIAKRTIGIKASWARRKAAELLEAL
jgi:hypothetical protein